MSRMLRYVIKRLLLIIPVILGVLIIVFFFQTVSGDDPVDQILTEGATEAMKEAKREELGLNDPIVVQFGRYVWKFVSQGDLGTSYKSGQPVTGEIMSRFPTTIKLALGSVLLSIIIGIPLGILAAVKQYTPTDSGLLAFSVLSASLPSFWFALLLISLFSVNLGWLPTSGLGGWKNWVMPVIVVSVASMSNIIRVTRSSMLETIRQDYIRTARAKGQAEYVIIFDHVLRNSLIPIVSAIGNTLGIQLGGSLIVESVFGLPGIGKYAVDAISQRNFPSLLGSVVILAITFSLVNLLVDLVYTMVDPRVKTSLFGKTKKKKPAPDRA